MGSVETLVLLTPRNTEEVEEKGEEEEMALSGQRIMSVKCVEVWETVFIRTEVEGVKE